MNEHSLRRCGVRRQDQHFVRTSLQQPFGALRHFRLGRYDRGAGKSCGALAGGARDTEFRLDARRDARLHACGQLDQQRMLAERFDLNFGGRAGGEAGERRRQDVNPPHADGNVLPRRYLEGALLVQGARDFQERDSRAIAVRQRRGIGAVFHADAHALQSAGEQHFFD